MHVVTPDLPEEVVGVDVETKSTSPTAYVVSIASVSFNVRTLSQTSAFYRTIDPNDVDAVACFTEDADTMKWWRGEGDPSYSPDPIAYKEAFSGTDKMPQVFKDLVDYLEPIRRKFKHVITTRGPEFDIPIISNVLRQCGLYEGIFRRYSANDSDRTAERFTIAFAFDLDYDCEKVMWCKTKEYVPHMPAFDAGMSAYRTARLYHLAYITRTYGYPKALEAAAIMRTGNYNGAKFLKELGE